MRHGTCRRRRGVVGVLREVLDVGEQARVRGRGGRGLRFGGVGCAGRSFVRVVGSVLVARVCAVFACCLVGAPIAFARPVLVPVAGSPFRAGGVPSSVAISPSGRLLATANHDDGTVSVFAVASSGASTQVAGSPFATGSDPRSVVFDAAGRLLATANPNGNSVSVFSVSSHGSLTPVASSPFSTMAPQCAACHTGATPGPTNPVAVIFTPGRGPELLTTANPTNSSVSVFSVGPAGQLAQFVGSPYSTGNGTAPTSVAFAAQPGEPLSIVTANPAGNSVSRLLEQPGPIGGPNPAWPPVEGSPFATGAGTNPVSVAVNPNGRVLATADKAGEVSVFSFSSTSFGLTQIVGSPFSTGAHSNPDSVQFSPNGRLLATANTAQNAVSLFSVSPSGLAPATGSPFSTGRGSDPVSVAFSPNGRLLAAADQGRRTIAVFIVTQTPPRLSALKVSPHAFRAATLGTAITRSHQAGGTVTYRDTLAARSTLRVLRGEPGVRRTGSRACAKPSKRNHHPGTLRRCTRWVPIGSFTHQDNAGLNRFRFSGRLAGRTVRSGSYLLQATAALAGATSHPITATFRIVTR